MAYVYRHIRIDKNQPFYIGWSNNNDGAYKRANEKEDRSLIWKAVAKNGYVVEIMVDNISDMEACEKEREFIKLYGRQDLGLGPLVNMTDGGYGLKNPSGLLRKRLSECFKGRFGGDKNPNYGKTHPVEARRKMSIAKKGIFDGENNPAYKGIIQAFKDGVLVGEFKGSGDCGSKLNIKKQYVLDCLCGRQKTAKGYSFKRVAA